MPLQQSEPADGVQTDEDEGLRASREANLQDEQSMGDWNERYQTAPSARIMQTMLNANQLPSPETSRSSSPELQRDGSSIQDAPEVDRNLHRTAFGSLDPTISRKSSASSIERVRSPVIVPKTELQDIPEEVRRPSKPSSLKVNGGVERVLKLSPRAMQELTSEPGSLSKLESPIETALLVPVSLEPSPALQTISDGHGSEESRLRANILAEALKTSRPREEGPRLRSTASRTDMRPHHVSRTYSTPPTKSPWPKTSGSVPSVPVRNPARSDQASEAIDHTSAVKPSKASERPHVPRLPLPPMSIHTYLQLELSSSSPSPFYINRSQESQIPYESSRVKFERLLNFLLLPSKLEHVLCFGALACLDAWLYTFTILPLRFFKAIAILSQWWFELLLKEIRFISDIIYNGLGRMWHRRSGRGDSIDSAEATRSRSGSRRPSMSTSPSFANQKSANGNAERPTFDGGLQDAEKRKKPIWGRRHHRRTKSQPSNLSPNHKADILQGLVIVCSCLILMRFDASRMYHSIRGQAAIKLYVIYNVLEVRWRPLHSFDY